MTDHFTYIAIVAAAVVAQSLIIGAVAHLKRRHDKQVIVRRIKYRRGSVKHLRFKLGLFRSGWEVTYVDRNGNRRTWTCHVPGWETVVCWDCDYSNRIR